MCIMFDIKSKNIKKLEKGLAKFSARSLPFATKKTLNDAAFAAQKIARADVKKNMINRNAFTVRSILVNQTKSLNINKQASEIGSIAPYMETQEFGGIKRKQGKIGTPIATSYSAGQSENAQPRTKLPRKANKLQNIQLKRAQIKAKNRKQRNAIAVRMASILKNKYVYLNLGQRQGIFKVLGKKNNIQVKMIHDLSQNSVKIDKNPWLMPATKEVKTMIPAFYADALRFQLRRNGFM